jgi:hypothetical protein
VKLADKLRKLFYGLLHQLMAGHIRPGMNQKSVQDSGVLGHFSKSDIAGDGAADAVVETFGRLSMDRGAHVLPVRVANRVVRGEGLADRHERLPLIAHQMRRHAGLETAVGQPLYPELA